MGKLRLKCVCFIKTSVIEMPDTEMPVLSRRFPKNSALCIGRPLFIVGRDTTVDVTMNN